MASLASLFAAIIPMVTYLLIIWWIDKYDREPLHFVFLHFIWGAFGAVLLGFAGSVFLNSLAGIATSDTGTSPLIQTIIFAPLSEEIAKGSLLLYTIKSKRFDNLTDGLVYGGAIGLGFGMTENFIYFLAYGDSLSSWIQIVLIRSLFSAVMHFISTASLGAALALAKFSNRYWRNLIPLIGLTISILIHFTWNSTVSFDGTFFYGFLFMIMLIIIFFSLFKMTLNNERKLIEIELSEESELNLIPPSHVKIISSHLRFRKGWIDERIREIYFTSAIRLAFRKNQLRNITDSSRDYYAGEVEKIRESIRSLLSNNHSVE